MRVLIGIIFLLTAFFGTYGCANSQQLSREKAESILNGSKMIAVAQVSYSSFIGNNDDKCLVASGYFTYGAQELANKKMIPTDKVKPLLVTFKDKPNSYFVTYARVGCKKVTGITMTSQSVAKVTYTASIKVDPNIVKCFQRMRSELKVDREEERTVTMRLYDDGWRLEDGTVDAGYYTA